MTTDGCENGCDLPTFGTHQDDCPFEPHDTPEVAKARALGDEAAAQRVATAQRDLASLRAALAAAEARAETAEGELREVRDQIAAVLDECERADDWMRRQYAERNGHGAVPNALEVAALSRLVTAKVRELLWPSSPSTVTLSATQPGVDEHSDSRNARRYDHCDNTCTVDCGHCKGQGPPVTPEPAEPERRTAICGHENFAQGFCVVDGCANDLHNRGPSSAAPAEPERCAEAIEPNCSACRCYRAAGHAGNHVNEHGGYWPEPEEQAMSEAIDKQVVDAVLDVLHRRKGFGWWWDGEFGSANRAEIKRQARARVRRILASPVGQADNGEGKQ